jgi:nicotinamidase-related amidase
MNTALLIIDIQNDYFPGGKHPLAGSQEAAGQAGLLLAHFRSLDWPRIFIRHHATRPGATFFLPGSQGAEIYPDLQPGADEMVITKHYPNCFRETNLLEHLQAMVTRRLVICGMMTHMCVEAGTRAATDLGFECWLAGDACATRDLNFGGEVVPARQVHLAVLAALNGTYARVLPTASILQELKS